MLKNDEFLLKILLPQIRIWLNLYIKSAETLANKGF